MRATRQETEDFIDRAPIKAVGEHRINAPIDGVFDTLADVESWTEWWPNMADCHWTSKPPYGVGSTRSVRVGPVRVDERFIVWDPPTRWGFTFVGCPGWFAKAGVEIIDLSPSGENQTDVRYTMAMEMRGPAAIVRPLFVPGAAMSLRRGLKALDAYLSS